MPLYTGNSSVNTTLSSTAFKLPTGTSDPSSLTGGLYYNTTEAKVKLYNGANWAIIKGFKDGSASSLAAKNASDIRELGISANGVYWIDLPVAGPTQVYCNMSTDSGGWMMLGYAGSTSGVGDSNHMMFNTIGTLATTQANNQTSFSRFDYARAMDGASSSSQAMWRRTTDSNKILIHSMDEMWNRIPGGSSAGNRDMNGSGSGYPITTMKMSRTGDVGLVTRTTNTGRYESGASYPGIAWNSSYNDNTDNVGGFDSYLNRRSIAYWETNGPQSQGQWFHGTVLSLGDGSGPTGSQSRKDIELYFRVRTPSI